MSQEGSPAEVRQALFDLSRYLSDQLAPMMVADSVEMLTTFPPELVAKEIHGWVGAQFRGPSDGLTVSDCLYHAVKKIHMMAEFELIERELLDQYIKELGDVILELCPSEDRELLKENLGRLGESEAGAATTSAATVLHRQARPGKAGPDGVAESGESVQAMRRFSLLIERLARGSEGGTTATDRAPIEAQLLTQAAVGARSNVEFERNVEQLGQMGIDAGMGRIFRALGGSLPGWDVVVPESAGESPVQASRPAKAMRRIVDMAADPEEGARRFNEMVQAAIEQFNEGRLVQSRTMLDLAERIVSENKLNTEVVKSIRERAHHDLSHDKLRLYADRGDKHDALRKVMDFFPAMTPEGLLVALHGEERRELRKLSLALLETHGAPAREAALQKLQACVAGDLGDNEGFYQRNLVFLLRRIPRPKGVDPALEQALISKLTGWDNAPILIKEALAALGHYRGVQVERVLMTRLHEIETMLSSGESIHETEELYAFLDRTVSALIQVGSRNGYRSVVTHALKRDAAFGDTMARLDELAEHDLSSDKELAAQLVKILQQELPTKVLGFVVGKNSPNAVHLIRALSRTPLPAVRQAFEDIRNRYSDSDFAEAASKALDGFGASSRPAEAATKSLTGDVELFGLPNLFQTLSDSQLTGTLTLTDREGEPHGVAVLESGKLRGCHCGVLRGEDAFYQMFERPVPGTFVFESQRTDVLPEGEGTAHELLPLVLEALRRYDELGQAIALVPDTMVLVAADAKPTAPENEADRDLMKVVWAKAVGGHTAAQCDSAFPVDVYRVRRLLAHWLEEGALKPRTATPSG